MDAVPREDYQRVIFSLADYFVFGLMLIVSAIIGLYYAFSGSKHKTTSDLLMGGRSMAVFPVSLSVYASHISAIGLLGVPSEIYTYGTQFWVIVFAYPIALSAVACLYVPTLYNLEITSAYEYLEMRFCRLTRTLASLSCFASAILHMALAMYAPALALSQATGFGVWPSVASIGAVCTFYTTVGGIEAVVWTDVFQAALMFLSMAVVVFKGATVVGGWKHVWTTNWEGDRIEFFNFNVSPTTRHSVWGLIIGGCFMQLGVFGTTQAMVQRYMTLPTLKKAQSVVWLTIPYMLVSTTLTSLAGLVIFAKFHDCDPGTRQYIQAQDQLLPLFVMETLGSLPGLPGLFVSGIFSGTLSSLSSSINSLAAVTLEDFVKSYVNPHISEASATRITKFLVLFYGGLAIALVAAAEQLESLLQAAIALSGMITGPVLGTFTLGLFFPWANSQGSLVGFVTGIVFTFWVGFGALVNKPEYPKPPVSTAGCSTVTNNNRTSPWHANMAFNQVAKETAASEGKNGPFGFFSLSYLWYGPASCTIVIVIGLIVSFISGPVDPQTINPDLICPIFDILCPYLPERIRQNLRFKVGTNYKQKPDDVDATRNDKPDEQTSTEGNPIQAGQNIWQYCSSV